MDLLISIIVAIFLFIGVAYIMLRYKEKREEEKAERERLKREIIAMIGEGVGECSGPTATDQRGKSDREA